MRQRCRLAGTWQAAEPAEVEINLGLVDTVAGQRRRGPAAGRHPVVTSRAADLTRTEYPQEYAILHNNLAIAYLSLPMADERAKMRRRSRCSRRGGAERHTLVDHPGEYAMNQNNLGNALQYAASGHALDNNLRALAAYAEALKVRNPRDTPLEYASTIANKANVLRNLPDDPDDDRGLGREGRLAGARDLYQEARGILLRLDQADSVAMIEEALDKRASPCPPATATRAERRPQPGFAVYRRELNADDCASRTNSPAGS